MRSTTQQPVQSGKYDLYIYFPAGYEQKREPFIIYVQKDWGERLQGNPDPDELDRGRFAHFLAGRCQPYSDELWAACQEWTQTYHAVQQRLKDLARGRYPGRFKARTRTVALKETP